MSAADRYLIVNADDFGRSDGINRGIVRGFEHGIVTSASLMVRWPAAEDAAAYARTAPGLGVGLHIDLGEWEFVAGEWRAVYGVAGESPAEIEDEIARQLERFRALLGRLPTHLDSHQHVHREEPVRHIVADAARSLALPLRGETNGIAYCGSFYGQTGTGEARPEDISTERLVELIRSIGAGVTELACHPGELDPGLSSVYHRERALELEALCSPLAAEAQREQGITCGTFASAARLLARSSEG